MLMQHYHPLVREYATYICKAFTPDLSQGAGNQSTSSRLPPSLPRELQGTPAAFMNRISMFPKKDGEVTFRLYPKPVMSTKVATILKRRQEGKDGKFKGMVEFGWDEKFQEYL